MRNKCFNDCRGVFATVLNDVQDTWGKASVTEYSANEIVSARAEFGCFETGKMLAEEFWGALHDSVSAGDRCNNGAKTK